MSTKAEDSIHAGYSSNYLAATAALRPLSYASSEGPNKNLHLNMQGFMSFLVQAWADIDKITVQTKGGQLIVASFPSGPMRPTYGDSSSVFNSLDLLKSLDSTAGREEPLETDVAEAKILMELVKDRTSAPVLTAFNRTVGSVTSEMYNPFESREWAAEYANTHVEVSYSGCFEDPSLPPAVGEFAASHQCNQHPSGLGALSELGQVAAALASASTTGGTSLPPKKRAARDVAAIGAAKTDWHFVCNTALKPLVEAAALSAKKEQTIPVGGTSGTKSNDSNKIPPTDASRSTGESSSSSVGGCQPKKKRKPRKIVPEVKLFVKFSDKDVLFGRGGRSNHHIGNKIYREIVTAQQERYRACDKNEKTKVAQTIVDRVQNNIGGRFLELDTATGKWFLVPNVVARRKVGQALRENNTEQARAAKRAKYQGGKANKKDKATTAIASESIGSRPVVFARSV
jgi:hypothetical protein